MNVLALPGTVCQREDGGPLWLALESHKWATLAWQLAIGTCDDGSCNGGLYLDPSKGAEWIFIFDPAAWLVVPTKPAYTEATGMFLRPESHHVQLLQYALQTLPSRFTFTDLCNLVEHFKLHATPAKCTRVQLLTLLADPSILQEVLLKDKKTTPKCEVTQEDAFLTEILEQLDATEADDFKEIKKAVKLKQATEKKRKWKQIFDARQAQKKEAWLVCVFGDTTVFSCSSYVSCNHSKCLCLVQGTKREE